MNSSQVRHWDTQHNHEHDAARSASAEIARGARAWAPADVERLVRLENSRGAGVREEEIGTLVDYLLVPLKGQQ